MNNDWYNGPAGYKTWANWHDKTYPTEFQKACNDSKKRQEIGHAQINARLDNIKTKLKDSPVVEK